MTKRKYFRLPFLHQVSAWWQRISLGSFTTRPFLSAFSDFRPRLRKLTHLNWFVHRLQPWAADQPAGKLSFFPPHFQLGQMRVDREKMAAAPLGTMCTRSSRRQASRSVLMWEVSREELYIQAQRSNLSYSSVNKECRISLSGVMVQLAESDIACSS